MKNFVITLFFLTFVLSGCKTPQDKVINTCENYLINNLKYPKTYKFINASIIDTITDLSIAKDMYDDAEVVTRVNKLELDEAINKLDSSNIEMVPILKERYETNLKVLESYKNKINLINNSGLNQIKEIRVFITFKCENEKKELITNETIVSYNP